jgi:hypothetical protein
VEVRHLTINCITGLLRLPDNADCELLNSPTKRARAWLTMDRESHFLHLRRCTAYQTMITQMLANRIAGPLAAPERFAGVLASTPISEGVRGDSPLLLIEVIGQIESIRTDRLNDMGTCGIGLQLFDSSELSNTGNSVQDAAIVGIALNLPFHTAPTIETIGTVAYALEPETERVFYSLELSMTGSVTSVTPIDLEKLNAASAAVQSLLTIPDLRRVVHLLSRSLQTRDDLQAFLTAWASFEIFLDKTFENYKTMLYAQLRSAIAPSATPFIERLKSVIETDARYNVRDKFVVVASSLNAAEATLDSELFHSLKKIRDDIHVMRSPASGYPTRELQNLLRKYLRLYVALWPC